MTGNEKYTRDMAAFEKSPLYARAYKGIVHRLWKNINREPIYADSLGAPYGLSKVQVRRILEHARRQGHPIAGGGKGYWMDRDYARLMEKGIAGLKERYHSLGFTIGRMEYLCRLPDRLKRLEREFGPEPKTQTDFLTQLA